jgi:ubiquinone/menaquinone biosynthesis C-methylase UbiE
MASVYDRVVVPELLDHASPEVARDNLRDLVRINRFFGGHSILHRIMADFVRAQDRFSMLDVGAASGDMGAALQRRYPRATITSLDRKCVHLEKAVHPKLAGDAFLLPFAARSFDFVFSSLFLHHFSDEQVVELFRNFRTVARRAVLAIDLERGPLAYYFIPATKWLFGWHDI